MENWGLIAYSESSLLRDPDYSTSSQMMSTARLIAHEMAHQVGECFYLIALKNINKRTLFCIAPALVYTLLKSKEFIVEPSN